MLKNIQSEKGSTLMMVFGFIVVLSIIIIPLALQTNVGLLQAKTGAHKETAFTQAHSAYTVFGRLYENVKKDTDSSVKKYSEQDIRSIYDAVSAMPEFSNVTFEWKKKANGHITILFTSESGIDNQKRVSVLKYPIDALPVIPVVPTPKPEEPGPTPSPTPTVPPITGNKSVIQSKVTNNKYYDKCPVSGTVDVDNSYTVSTFKTAFGYYADYYLTTLFQSKTESKLDTASKISKTKTETTEKVLNGTGQVGAYAGDVKIIGTNSDVTLTGGIEVAGNVHFAENISKITTVNGKTKVGGNMTIQNVQLANAAPTYTQNEQLVFMDDVYIRGDALFATIGPINKLIVKGDLVIGGKLDLKHAAFDLLVEGDLIVGGDIIIGQMNTIHKWTVNGSMLIKGSMEVANSIDVFKVGGDFITKKDFIFNQHVKDLQVGGSMVAGKDMLFKSNLDSIIVGKDLISSKNFKIGLPNKQLSLNGYFMVFENADFKELNNDRTKNQMKGFMVGGMTDFPSYAGEKHVCITG